jgi:hypothetical protein
MHASLRVHRQDWLSGGAHLLIIAVAAQFDTLAAWPWALAAMAVVSFSAWIAHYQRLRRIADTPLSNIASAAQGYAEIAGTAEAGATPLLSRLTHLPCLWFQYEVYEKSSDGKWTLHESGNSDLPFVLRDATGACGIDPRGAEIVTDREQTWTTGDFRYHERLLLAQERIYGLGEFATVGGAARMLDARADTGALLAAWKREPAKLLERFDLNRDGQINLGEWELARRQAQREVDATHRELRANDGIHILRAPADGRLFLLSNYLPDKLQSRYARWAWFHAFACIAASGLAVALL